jgi:hypothetical protein
MFTLADHLSSEGPFESFDAVGWALRTARQVESLHARGLVHGRISTLSVLTDGPECTEPAYLAAVPEAPDVPAHYSPERAARGRPSVADDVWAIAVTLYQLLTGRLPFSGVSEDDIRARIRAGNPAPLAVFGIDDEGLQSILDRVFARAGDRHPPSAAEGEPIRDAAALAAELVAWLPDPAFGDLPALGDGLDEQDPVESQRTGIRSSVFLDPRAYGEPDPADRGELPPPAERDAAISRRAREIVDAVTRAHTTEDYVDDDEDGPATNPYRLVAAIPDEEGWPGDDPDEDRLIATDDVPTAVAFGWPPMPISQVPPPDDDAPPTAVFVAPPDGGASKLHGLRWTR